MAADPLVLIALAIAILALAISALKGRDKISLSASRLVSNFQKLRTEVDSLSGQLGPDIVKLKKEVEVLRAQLERLSSDTSVLSERLFEEERQYILREEERLAAENLKLSREVAVAAEERGVDVGGWERPAGKEKAVETLGEVRKEPATLTDGLSKTRQGFLARIKSVFSKKPVLGREEQEAIEELLIGSDLGVATTKKLMAGLFDGVALTGGSRVTEDKLREHLKQKILQIVSNNEDPEIIAQKRDGQPLVVLMVGVNGVGKTTSIAKLAQNFKNQGARVLLGACDTFRAAATDQLEIWAQRIGVDIVVGNPGAKPSAVAYDTIHKGINGNFDVVIIDTAGRLHTRVNLMEELRGIINIIAREQPGAPHETLLVLDAATGQNALQQAREFHGLSNLTGVIVTKLDGTPKGGIVVAIKDELNIPVRYIGIGETAGDLRAFSAHEFVDALFEDKDELL
ncbi:MAG: signal recognition particle-docking protein FtsY, partial [Deltaproteobacteria bacterium]|nr:signal recognition particle-docking protein FtsY [Deltaproteobacteria bacterium]